EQLHRWPSGLVTLPPTDTASRVPTRGGSSMNDSSRLLTRVNVRAALEEKRKAIAMGAWEVIQRHSEIARASLDDFLEPRQYPELDYARARGKAHLLRSLKVTTRTIPQRGAPPIIERNVSFELHDARAAQQTLMKYHGLLVDMPAIRDLPKTGDSSSRWPCARFSASRARRRASRGRR